MRSLGIGTPIQIPLKLSPDLIEVHAGKLHGPLVVDAIQGGVNTLTGMNANEVIAHQVWR